MAWEDGAKCTTIGHGVGYGLRLCEVHEAKLLAYLMRRKRDAEARQIAEEACGDHWSPAIDPGRARGFWEVGSAGAPTLGKDR